MTDIIAEKPIRARPQHQPCQQERTFRYAQVTMQNTSSIDRWHGMRLPAFALQARNGRLKSLGAEPIRI
jgi:hypothetical protein